MLGSIPSGGAGRWVLCCAAAAGAGSALSASGGSPGALQERINWLMGLS